MRSSKSECLISSWSGTERQASSPLCILETSLSGEVPKQQHVFALLAAPKSTSVLPLGQRYIVPSSHWYFILNHVYCSLLCCTLSLSPTTVTPAVIALAWPPSPQLCLAPGRLPQVL